MPAETDKKPAAIVREATLGDLPAIRAIYNHFVLNTTVTFEIGEQTAEASRTWFDNHKQADLPIFVAEHNGEIIGWASLSQYSQRCGYRTTVEPSVYVHPDRVRRGVGKTLMDQLIEAAQQRKLHCLIGLVCSENQTCLKWIETCGFGPIGELKEVGRKFDRWLDVTIMQRMLSS